MKASFGFFPVMALVFGFGSFAPDSQAQCENRYGGSRGGGLLNFLGEVLLSHDHYHDDHYYEYHYEYEPRYHRHYGDSPECDYVRGNRAVRGRVHSRELIPPLPENRGLPGHFKRYTPVQPRVTAPPVTVPNNNTAPRNFDKQPIDEAPTSTTDLPGYLNPTAPPAAPEMNTQEGNVSPYQNNSPKAEQTPPAPQKTPARSFDLQLPNQAPRDLRKMDRISPPDPVNPPKAVGNSNNSSSNVAATAAKFPLDMVIANSDDEFTTVREVIGDNEAILIDFWASWCAPCIESMPELKRRSEVLAEYGIVVAGMNVEGDITKANQTRQRYGMQSVAWLVEPESMPFSNQFKINSIPQVMLISRDGDVIFQGYPNDRTLEAALEDLVAE